MTTRSPAVAGQFYEGAEDRLREQVEWAFTHDLGPGSVPDVHEGSPDLRGLVVPHAGYQFSGPIAAQSYAALARAGSPDAAVIVGPNHRGPGAPVALPAADAWRTPLGTVEIASDLQDDLLDTDVATEDGQAHAGEHAAEVQLPFLQFCYPDISVLPIAMSTQDLATSRELGTALADCVAGDEDVVFVASTDLTHYEPHEEALERDERALAAIEAGDLEGLYHAVENEGVTMCGYGPTAAVLTACEELGATDVEQYTHATSADAGGDPERVVGYAAAGIGAD